MNCSVKYSCSQCKYHFCSKLNGDVRIWLLEENYPVNYCEIPRRTGVYPTHLFF